MSTRQRNADSLLWAFAERGAVHFASRQGSHRKSEKHRNVKMECYLVFGIGCIVLCHSELFHAFSIIKQFPFISLYDSSYVLHVVARSYSECPGGCRAHWCRHRTSFQFGGSADFHLIIVGKKGKIDSFALI